MSMWQEVLEVLKKAGLSRSAIKKMYGSRRVSRHRGSSANRYPKGHTTKQKRKKKAQKESRRRNR